MSSTATAGFDTIILADTLDLQQILTTARMPLTKGNIETPRFGRRDMESISSMRGGALNFEGFRVGNREQYTNLVQKSIGPDNSKRIITYAPEGDKPGDQCFLIDSHQNSIEVGAPYNQAVMITGVFAATGGPRWGTILKGCHQEDLYFEAGSYEIGVKNLPMNEDFYIGGLGSNRPSNSKYNMMGLTTSFIYPGNDDFNSQLKTAFEAMALYAGRVFTITSNLVIANGFVNGKINLVISGGETLAPKLFTDKAGTVSLGVGQTNVVYDAADGIAAVQDDLFSTVSGYTAHFHCIGNKNLNNNHLVVKIQHSSDNVTWGDLVFFDVVQDNACQRIVSAGDYEEVKRYTRCWWRIVDNDIPLPYNDSAHSGFEPFAFAVALSRYGRNFK